MKVGISFVFALISVLALSSLCKGACYTGKIILKIAKDWKGYSVKPPVDEFIKEDMDQYKGIVKLDFHAGGKPRLVFEDICYQDQNSYGVAHLSRAQVNNVVLQLIEKMKSADFKRQIATADDYERQKIAQDTEAEKFDQVEETPKPEKVEIEKETEIPSFNEEYDL